FFAISAKKVFACSWRKKNLRKTRKMAKNFFRHLPPWCGFISCVRFQIIRCFPFQSPRSSPHTSPRLARKHKKEAPARERARQEDAECCLVVEPNPINSAFGRLVQVGA